MNIREISELILADIMSVSENKVVSIDLIDKECNLAVLDLKYKIQDQVEELLKDNNYEVKI